MTDLQKEIDQAFKLASAVPVNGDAVDIMAEVRNHLRTAYKLATEPEESKDG